MSSNDKTNIFINNMNSKLSSLLIEKLKEDKNFVFNGNLLKEGKLPKNFKPNIINIDYKRDYANQDIFNMDVYVYSLDNLKYEEIEYLLKGLKTLKHSKDKHLILISNIMTWAKTKPRVQKEANQEEKDEDADMDNADADNQDENKSKEDKEDKQINEENQEEALEEDDIIQEELSVIEDDKQDMDAAVQEQKEPKKFIQFKDKDFIMRLPSEKYIYYKSIETQALSASATNKNLKCYVICPGFVYGSGEDFFYEYFKRSWLQNPDYLPVKEKGKNWIPTIHIKDLISLIHRVITKPPKEQYIFAVDRTKNRSLINIIQSIAKGVGNGKVTKEIEKNQNFKSDSKCNLKFEELSIDLKVKASKVFDDTKKDEEEEEDFEKRKFKWHCEFGIPENQEMLRKEFTEGRKLTPVKVIISGPPGAGKSTLAKELSERYNLPLINIKDIVSYGKGLQNELGEEVNKEIEEERNRVFTLLQEEENKKKNPQELDINNVKIKEFLPLKIVNKVIKVLLKENIYRNRGYILDNYPKSYLQAKEVFTFIDEEKDENDPNRESILQEILPDSFINLECENDYLLIDRFKQMSENEIVNTHYNHKDMMRRLATYRKENNKYQGDYIIDDFFKQQQIETFSTDASQDKDTILKLSRLYIERKGKINNYLNDEVLNEEVIKKEKVTSLETNSSLFTDQNKRLEYYELNQKQNIKEANDKKKANITSKEAETLKNKSKDLQTYLTENVIPILSQGILEICKKCPDDPVDELAKFLMEKSINVAFKDPSKYKGS